MAYKVIGRDKFSRTVVEESFSDAGVAQDRRRALQQMMPDVRFIVY